MMTITLRFVVFKVGHKALSGVLKRPQSALWCFKWATKHFMVFLMGETKLFQKIAEIYANKQAIQFSMLNPKLKHHKALCGV